MIWHLIWQLMRRDQTWKILPKFAAASALACLAWHFVPGGSAVLLLLCAYPLFSLPQTYASNTQHRDVYFQASLPIAPKHIYMSRVFPMIVLLWLPVAIGAVFGQATGQPGFTVTLLDFGSLFFVAIMAVQSVAIQCKLNRAGVSAFNLFWLAGWGLCVISAISGLPAWLLRQGLLATIAFPAVCWLSVAAIVRGTWRAPASGIVRFCAWPVGPARRSPVDRTAATACRLHDGGSRFSSISFRRTRSAFFTS